MTTHTVAALEGKGNASVHLTKQFAAELRAFGISTEIIEALRKAMAVMSRNKDDMGYGYARWMRSALIEYGLDKMKQQTQFMVARMNFWTGEEADSAKAILRKWSMNR